VVADISIGSSEWSPAFVDYLHDHGLGNGGYSIPTGHGSQVAPLPWNNLNRIQITFDSDVVVDRMDLMVNGLDQVYAVDDFEYSRQTRTATWQLAESLASDQIRIQLNADGDDPVRSTSGAILDGDWADRADMMPSGDGVSGGNFQFTLNVVAGDVNHDALTSRIDYVQIDQVIDSTVGDATYDPMRDVDGSGQINFVDLMETISHDGLELPLSSPVSSGSAPSISLSCGSVGANLWWFTGSVTDPDGPTGGWDVDLEGIIRTYVTTNAYGNYEHFEYMGTSGGGSVYAYTEDPQGNLSNLASCVVWV
jgi:hypothetical protein